MKQKQRGVIEGAPIEWRETMPENLEPRLTRDYIQQEIKKRLRKGIEVIKFNWSGAGPPPTDPVVVVYTGNLDDVDKRHVIGNMRTKFDAMVDFKQHQAG